MTTQRRNPELVELLAVDLQKRYEPNFAWGQASGVLLASQLRGHWTMASVDESGNVYDATGQGRTLTNNNAATFNVQGLLPYVRFIDTSTQYLSRADESGLDITGDLTCGAWVYFDNAASAKETVIAKEAGAASRSWQLVRLATGVANFSISSDCTAWVNAPSTGTTMSATTWYFLWGRYIAAGVSSRVDVGINRDYWSQADTNGSICNSGAALTIGASGVVDAYMDGRAALPFLCAEALSDAQVWNIYEQTRAMLAV